MKEFKGTPGPWRWRKDKDWDYHELAQVGCDEYDRVISDGSAGGEYSPTIDVNGPDALLIAAAPDLLDALQKIISSAYEIEHDFYGLPGGEELNIAQVINDARAAIARALGEKQ